MFPLICRWVSGNTPVQAALLSLTAQYTVTSTDPLQQLTPELDDNRVTIVSISSAIAQSHVALG